MIKIVVFDLDGTLTQFNLKYRTVRKEVRRYLISRQIPPQILTLNESIFKMLEKVEIFLENQGEPRRLVEEIRSEALAIVEKFEWEAAKTTEVLPDVLETLKELKEGGMKVGLFTINGEKSVNHILRRFNLKDFFDAVTPRNHVKCVKPNREHLEATLKELGADPKETVVVGDTGSDMECAEKMGAIAVGLPTGISSIDRLIACGAQYVITEIKDLIVLIEEIQRIKG
ncbi:MAG: HAD family hydrolase [Thermoproteota archaeon]